MLWKCFSNVVNIRLSRLIQRKIWSSCELFVGLFGSVPLGLIKVLKIGVSKSYVTPINMSTINLLSQFHFLVLASCVCVLSNDIRWHNVSGNGRLTETRCNLHYHILSSLHPGIQPYSCFDPNVINLVFVACCWDLVVRYDYTDKLASSINKIARNCTWVWVRNVSSDIIKGQNV